MENEYSEIARINRDNHLSTTKILCDIIKEQQSFITTLLREQMYSTMNLSRMVMELFSTKKDNILHTTKTMQDILREEYEKERQKYTNQYPPTGQPSPYGDSTIGNQYPHPKQIS